MVLSPERISPRSIVPLRTSHDGSQSLSFMPSSLVVPLSNFHTPSVLQSHSPSLLTHMEPPTRPQTSLSRSFTRTLISDQESLSRSLTWPSQSTSRPQRTATLPTKTSAGRSQRLSSCRSIPPNFLCDYGSQQKTQRLSATREDLSTISINSLRRFMI